MNKLLSSGFSRILKSKLFRLITALSAAYAVFMRVNIRNQEEYYGIKLPIDMGFFAMAVFIGIAIAVFASIFVGTDYSDGTIRNKITAGHKRTVIYLSNLILVSVSGMAFILAYCLSSFVTGAILQRWFSDDVLHLLLNSLICISLTIAYSAIFVFIAMLFQNRTSSAVICLLTSFIMLFASMSISQLLSAPEYYDNFIYDVNGDIVGYDDPIPNPDYPRGLKRELLLAANDVLPSGQALQVSQMYSDEFEFEYRLPLYSLAIIVLFTGTGIALFRKKDLK